MTDAPAPKTRAPKATPAEEVTAAISDVTSAQSFSEMFDKSLARAKDAHEKMTTLAENTAEAFEEAFSCANRGSAEYRLKMLQIARANTNAMLDFAQGLFRVKTPAELVDLSSSHARRQFEVLTGQMKELSELTQKVVSETTQPIRNGITEPFKMAS
jgi:phasin